MEFNGLSCYHGIKNGGIFLRYKGTLGLLILAWIMTLLNGSSLQAAPKARFSIVYSNDVMGEVEPCG